MYFAVWIVKFSFLVVKWKVTMQDEREPFVTDLQKMIAVSTMHNFHGKLVADAPSWSLRKKAKKKKKKKNEMKSSLPFLNPLLVSVSASTENTSRFNHSCLPKSLETVRVQKQLISLIHLMLLIPAESCLSYTSFHAQYTSSRFLGSHPSFAAEIRNSDRNQKHDLDVFWHFILF